METPELQAMVRELGLLQRVEFCSYVPYAELPDLYRGALALVYPSLWEGFGLPIVEAMACGTPVITSKGSGTEEVAGDAAILVDPKSTSALADAVRQLAEQPDLGSRLRLRGLEHLYANGHGICPAGVDAVFNADRLARFVDCDVFVGNPIADWALVGARGTERAANPRTACRRPYGCQQLSCAGVIDGWGLFWGLYLSMGDDYAMVAQFPE